ncbi:sensor histidine kinase [Porphyromonas endodontalis]|jgi:signal transduction histidine kinase, lytS|uniref:sensor histidine kinase n=1 Tax=Porphyromonas endodontalis TaxID=28124 RepID=UPI0023F53934|nr:histidine kinase [Porphyromonas endodontalis]
MTTPRIKRRLRQRRSNGFIFLRDEKKSVLLATLIISFLLAFVMLSSSIYYYSLLDAGREFDLRTILSVNSIASLLVNMVFFYLLLSIQSWAINRYDIRQYQLWLILFGLLMGVVLLSPYLSRLQWWWFRDILNYHTYATVQYAKDLVILVVTFLFTMTIYLMKQNHLAVVGMQKLDFENLQNRYTALKNQTDPHFLFNCLNTLNGLIGRDDRRAQEYVQELAMVFRHTMRDKVVVRLSEELEFVKSYLYLMCIRYFDGLKVVWHIDDKYLDYYVIPSGLQILVENAIKHNIASAKIPLTISISTKEDKIVVENKLQLREQSTSSSTGVGLDNLMEQYRLVFGKDIDIVSKDGQFSVSLPLIKSLDQLEPKAKSLI